MDHWLSLYTRIVALLEALREREVALGPSSFRCTPKPSKILLQGGLCHIIGYGPATVSDDNWSEFVSNARVGEVWEKGKVLLRPH